MSLDPFLQHGDFLRTSQLAAISAVPSGYTELDEMLPEGGWPRGAVTEILMARQGISTLRLLMPALSQLSHDDRWICWVAPPHMPCAEALVAAGIDLSRVLLVHPKAQQDGLRVVEQSLRSGRCCAVLAWPTLDGDALLRRLQHAAEAGDALGFLFRSQQFTQRSSPAALRIQLDVDINNQLLATLLKHRGGWAAGPVQFDTAFRHGVSDLHLRNTIVAGRFQSPQWQ